MASKNLTVGKGEVWFAPYLPGTMTPTGYRLIGNCPEFSMTVEGEDLDHFSSMRGIKEKDGNAQLSRSATGNLNTDDISPENLAIFLMGAQVQLTQASATAVLETFLAVIPGLSYQLGESPTNPSGVREVASVVVKNDATPTPVTYTVGTDYTVDTVLGMVTPVAGGAIVAGTNLKITYNITASTRTRIASGEVQVEGAMKFIAYNGVGSNLDWFFPRMKMKANGDLNLITEEWMSIPFSVEALKKNDLALVYCDGRAIV